MESIHALAPSSQQLGLSSPEAHCGLGPITTLDPLHYPRPAHGFARYELGPSSLLIDSWRLSNMS